MYGFSQRDTDKSRNIIPKRNDTDTTESSSSDGISIQSVGFGDKVFAFRWMNQSFEEIAVSHPTFDKMIGLVVSAETRALVRGVLKLASAFGQGFKVTTFQLLTAMSILEKFYAERPVRPPTPVIEDLHLIEEARHYFQHAIVAYGWRGLYYLGEYGKYLRAVQRSKSNREAIVKFLRIPPQDLLGYEYGVRKGAVFQPSYFVSVDRPRRAIILGIRGTWSLYDCITDLVCEYRPWKGGLAHSGMLASAQWFFTNIIPQIFHYVHNHAGQIDSFVITGHSLGGGSASLLTMMVVDHIEELRHLSGNPNFRVHCYSYAPVAAVTEALSDAYAEYIDSFVCQDDIVGRTSYGTAMELKELIMNALAAVEAVGGVHEV
ncbi:Alpha/Beta hydrolase protein, partial [Umbelopsis sp. AD052]